MKNRIVSMLAGTLMPLFVWAAPPSSDYELVYQDEFSGTNLNSSDWVCRTGRRTGPNMNGLNLQANVSVSSGQLRIATRQEQIDGKLENTGGGVISRHNFGYGYYETLSTPFMAGHGVHSSFWQSGGNRANNNIFEIDAYEIDSRSEMACHNLYLHLLPGLESGYDHAPWVHRANVPFRLKPDGSYLCGYEYTPEGVIFYSQGRKVAQADWPELTAQQTVLLTALNGVGKVDGQPGETTFDYFRYYAKDYPGVNLLPNGSFEYNQGRSKPSSPIAWQISGDADAVRIVEGGAFRDRFKLRLGGDNKSFAVTLRQKLEFIRNGNYELTAMARRSGAVAQAELSVEDCGAEAVSAPIRCGANWTMMSLPNVAVFNHSATVRIAVRGSAEQWVELDDLRFEKPIAPVETAVQPPPFEVCGDPIWSLARREPLAFSGDAKFYFFDRNVGIGPAITVAFTVKPQRRMDTCPIARTPQAGTSGWAVLLTADGKIILRIGSRSTFEDIAAKVDYPAQANSKVACIFYRGAAKMFVNGRLVASRTGLRCNTSDTTAPGRIGCVDYAFDTVGDVMMRAAASGKKFAVKAEPFVGELRDVRIYNRALPDATFEVSQE